MITRTTRRGYFQLGAWLFSFLLSVSAALAQGNPPPGAAGAEPTGPQGEVIPLSSLGKSAIGLKVETAEKKLLPLEIRTTGKIEAIPIREFIQHAPLTGRITEVLVDLGDPVKAGDTLVTVDSPDINELAAETLQNKAELEAEIIKNKALLDAEVNQAKVQVNLWDLNYKRDKKLYDEGILALKSLLESQAELKLAESRLTASMEKRDIVLQALKTKLKLSFDSLIHKLRQFGVPERAVKSMLAEQHTIVSVPVVSARAGVVTDIQAFTGEGIDLKEPLFRVSDLKLVWATADVYEDDMARMRVGQPVKVTVAALPQETFIGKLTYIGRQVNEDTRTLPVRIEIANPEIKLKPGMFATIYIQTAEPAPSIIVPREAVIDSTGHYLVFLETKGGYQPCRVKLGRSLGDTVEIVDGLQPGQRLVVRGAFQLASELLKTHGSSDLFRHPTQGDHEVLEDDLHAAEEAAPPWSYPIVAVVVLVAFILGFVISIFVQCATKHDRPEAPAAKVSADGEPLRRG